MNNTVFLIKFIIGIIMCTSGIITMIFFLYKAYKIAKKPIIDERGMLIQDSYIKINKRDKNLVIKEAEGELDICDDTSFLVDYDDDIYPLNTNEFIQPTVKALMSLAKGKDILEFGIGTGRIAIPLAKKGYQLSGIDYSKEMLAVLNRKKGSIDMLTYHGDMTLTRLDKSFDLVYLIFNGITYLLTLDEQLECFYNASRHLKSGGRFVVETFIPKVDQIVKDNVAPYALEEGYIGFDKYNLINQNMTSYQYSISEDGKSESYQTTHRYIWPSELALMGKLAGFKLIHQWQDWEGNDLEPGSDDCIMVFEKYK